MDRLPAHIQALLKDEGPMTSERAQELVACPEVWDLASRMTFRMDAPGDVPMALRVLATDADPGRVLELVKGLPESERKEILGMRGTALQARVRDLELALELYPAAFMLGRHGWSKVYAVTNGEARKLGRGVVERFAAELARRDLSVSLQMSGFDFSMGDSPSRANHLYEQTHRQTMTDKLDVAVAATDTGRAMYDQAISGRRSPRDPGAMGDGGGGQGALN